MRQIIITQTDIANKNQLKKACQKLIDDERLSFKGKEPEDMRPIITEILAELNIWETSLESSVNKVISHIFTDSRSSMPKHSDGTSIVVNAVVDSFDFNEEIPTTTNGVDEITISVDECKKKYQKTLSTIPTRADKIRFLIRNVGYKPSFIRDVLGMKNSVQIVSIRKKM